MPRRIATIVTLVLALQLGVAAAASAQSVTVTIPCGCQPVVAQPVGNCEIAGPAYTPAINNPSGVVEFVPG